MAQTLNMGDSYENTKELGLNLSPIGPIQAKLWFFENSIYIVISYGVAKRTVFVWPIGARSAYDHTNFLNTKKRRFCMSQKKKALCCACGRAFFSDSYKKSRFSCLKNFVWGHTKKEVLFTTPYEYYFLPYPCKKQFFTRLFLKK